VAKLSQFSPGYVAANPSECPTLRRVWSTTQALALAVAIILALAAAVILSRDFPPPKCVAIGGVLVVAGQCP
jgi:hypothetical protein